MMNLLDIPFYLTFVVCLVYVVVTRGYYLLMVAHNLKQRFEDLQRQESQDTEMILHSRFTIPISLIVYHDKSEALLHETLQSLVVQKYPEFEIIVMMESALAPISDETLKQYQLKPSCHLFSKIIPTRQVQGILQSGIYNNLKFVIKESDTYADAINLGTNLARYRYVLPLESGIILENEALLKLIQPALANPKETLAVSTPVALAGLPTSPGSGGWREFRQHLWLSLQTLEQLRNSLSHRFSWRQRRVLVGGLGGIWGDKELVMWRKDVLLNLGGFANGGALEFSLRLYQSCIRQALSCQLWGITEAVAWTRPTTDMQHFLAERSQAWGNLRATLYKHRKLLLNFQHGQEYRRDFGVLGSLVLPFLALETRFGHWCELACFTLVPIGCLCGALPVSSFFFLVTLLIGTSWLISLLSLNAIVRTQQQLQVKELWLYILGGFVDYLGFQQLVKFFQLRLLRRQSLTL